MSSNDLDKLFQDLESSYFGQLREWQAKVLKNWEKNTKNCRLISLKVPTGTGKTLVSVLVLEYYRRQNLSVLYVANDYFLANDVLDHCGKLNIPSVILESFNRSIDKTERKINHNKYFNEKSVVGITVSSNLLKSFDLGFPDVLLIDDADNFIPELRERFSIKISRESYSEFWKSIVERIDRDRYLKEDLLKSKIEQSTISELIYFSDFWELIADFEKFFNTITKDSDLSLFWSINNNKTLWKKYLLIITNKGLELLPYIPPSLTEMKFKQLKKLILISATLNQPSLLNFEFGVDFSDRFVFDEDDFSPNELNTGVRIIYPVSDNKGLNPIKSICESFNKIIFMVPSHPDADLLKKEIISNFPNIYIEKYDKNTTKLDNFNKRQNGIMIIAGRYFGLDFSSEYPQILVLTKIPYFSDSFDEVERNKFRNDYAFYDRVSRRLIQAFGRCNRSEHDQSVILVLDNGLFNDYTGERKLLTYSSSSVMIDLKLGFDYAHQYCFLPMVLTSITEFFTEKYDILKDRNDLRKIYKHEKVSEASARGLLEEVSGWNLYLIEDFIKSSSMFKKAASMILTSLEETDDLTLKNRMALNYYFAAMASFFQYNYNPTEVKLFEETKFLLSEASKCSDLTWFKRLQLLPIVPKENIKTSKDIEKYVQSLNEWANNPESFFGSRIWYNDIIQKFKDDFIQIFKLLLDKSQPQAYGTRLHVVFERILKELVQKFTTEIEVEKFGIYDSLNSLYLNQRITKETLKIGTTYKNSPNQLRNTNIHRGKDTKTFSESFQTFFSWQALLKSILEDIALFDFIESKLEPSLYENLKTYPDFSNKTDKIIERMLISQITEGTIKYEINWSDDTFKINKIDFTFKSGKKIKVE